MSKYKVAAKNFLQTSIDHCDFPEVKLLIFCFCICIFLRKDITGYESRLIVTFATSFARATILMSSLAKVQINMYG